MPLPINNSKRLFDRAHVYFPGGVNSPVRAFKEVGGTPRFIDHAAGAYLFDADGNRYIDYLGSWGAMILGHSHVELIAALEAAIQRGSSYGAPTESEINLAQLIVEAIPSIEKLRFVNSGTEATMSAIRLARGYTKRDRIIKFTGCYHGHADAFLVKAGSGMATLGLPDSRGVPKSAVEHTLVLPFNDLDAVKTCYKQFPDDIAAIIVEPIAGNMGVIPPMPDFLQGLHRLSSSHQSVLIFDEVITGFRVAYGGAQTLFGLRPDLTCLGKIIGGGFPVGAYGGRRELMDLIAPLGPVYQAGTLSGNPVAMAAGIATLKQLRNSDAYQHLEALSDQFERGLLQAARSTDLPFHINRVGSMLSFFFHRRNCC